MEPLDNPVWHTLGGVQRRFAECGAEGVVRYDGDVAPFAALPDVPTPAAWEALRALVGAGGVAVLFRDQVAPPDGWQELFRFPTLQMVGDRAEGEPLHGAAVLAAGDLDAMVALATRTAPGPFGPRTRELGTYLGVRHEGALVAMAGERMRFAGATEISAVCTDPDHRGRGLAAGLVRAMVAHVRARGDVPFLHVVHDNHAAIRVYERLGFARRRLVEVVGVGAPP